MDKESMLQAAEEEWLRLWKKNTLYIEDYEWHWYWLILAESIWPTPDEDAANDFRKWLYNKES